MQLNARNRELAVEIDGAGPPVLMVHGLGGTTNFYQVQADALAGQFQVIRVDSAGAGRSPVADGISIGSHADDLVAVLDQLGIESAALVGHSMGTLVVRDLAARYPGRVSKLVLLGAVAPPADAVRKAQRDRAALLREKGTAAMAPGVVANALSEATRRDKPEVAAFVRELVMRQDPEGYARNCEGRWNQVRRRARGHAQGGAGAHRHRRGPDQAVHDRRGDHRHPAGRGHLLLR
jgi:pimeloyl-ACP methyl ester carboxylesterase